MNVRAIVVSVLIACAFSLCGVSFLVQAGERQLEIGSNSGVPETHTIIAEQNPDSQVDLDPIADKFLFAIGAQGAVGKFSDPFGIAVSADGSVVYVAEAEGHRIQRFSGTGEFLSTWGALGGGEGQLYRPAGLAMAPGGTLYIVEEFNHRVQRFSATGQFLGKWGSFGSGAGQFSYPRGISVAADGSVYVADKGNHRIQQFTAEGVFIRQWGSLGSDAGQFKEPSGVAVAPAGTVYVADTNNHRIQRFSATGVLQGSWGSEGAGSGQFKNPFALTVASDGKVWVSDTGNHRVQRFSSSGSFEGAWGSPGKESENFNSPHGITVVSGGSVYVADTTNHRVQRLTQGGVFQQFWGERGQADGQFYYPRGVGIAGGGNIYVADTSNNRIQYFGSNGLFLGKWGSFGTGTGFFKLPDDVGLAADGAVYVADMNNQRIQQFTSGGSFMRQWGAAGSEDGQFASPSGVAVGSDRSVFVADLNNHRIQRFTENGTFQNKWGTSGSASGQFTQPYDVATASDGTVLVADTYNVRIQRFRADGTYLSQWGGKGTGSGLFDYPLAVAAAPDGSVYIADGDLGGAAEIARIQRFSNTGTFLGLWGMRGPGTGQFKHPRGIAVGASGMVCVADNGNQRIQCFGATYPTTWRVEFFGNRWLTERPLLIQNPTALSYDWGSGSPGSGVPSDNFSVRAQRIVWFDAGEYEFTLRGDDGLRLWIDDRLLIEQWRDPQVATYRATLALSQGDHEVRVEHYDAAGGAALSLSWGRAATPTPTPTATPGTGVVQGRAYYDANRNGLLDGGEPGLAGAVMGLRMTSTGELAYTASSDSAGDYRFLAVAPGQYTLSEQTPPPAYQLNTAFALTFVVSAGQTVSGLNIGHQQLVSTSTFTPTPTRTFTPTATPTRTFTPTPTPTWKPDTGDIAGVVFNDLNRNGIREAGEPGLQGITVWLEKDGTLRGTMTTDAGGVFAFVALPPGLWNTRLILDQALEPVGWSNPASWWVTAGTRIDGQLGVAIRLTVTPTRTQTATPTRTGSPSVRHTFLPVLLRVPTPTPPPLPAAPGLNAIVPPDSNPSYAVRWAAVTGANEYVLERATSASFADAAQVYRGSAIEQIMLSEGIATYHYRVKARNAWGASGWSNVQAVEVRWEYEPNEQKEDATGPIRPGPHYFGVLASAADTKDYFYFDLTSTQNVELWLSNMGPGQDFDLVLRDVNLNLVGHSGEVGNANEHILSTPLPAGRYYVQVQWNAGASPQPYHLRGAW